MLGQMRATYKATAKLAGTVHENGHYAEAVSQLLNLLRDPGVLCVSKEPAEPSVWVMPQPYLNEDVISLAIKRIVALLSRATRSKRWQLGDRKHINVETGDAPELVLIQTPWPKNAFDGEKLFSRLANGKMAIGSGYLNLLAPSVKKRDFRMADVLPGYFEDAIHPLTWNGMIEEGYYARNLYLIGIVAIAGSVFIKKLGHGTYFTTTESGDIIGNLIRPTGQN